MHVGVCCRTYVEDSCQHLSIIAGTQLSLAIADRVGSSVLKPDLLVRITRFPAVSADMVQSAIGRVLDISGCTMSPEAQKPRICSRGEIGGAWAWSTCLYRSGSTVVANRNNNSSAMQLQQRLKTLMAKLNRRFRLYWGLIHMEVCTHSRCFCLISYWLLNRSALHTLPHGDGRKVEGRVHVSNGGRVWPCERRLVCARADTTELIFLENDRTSSMWSYQSFPYLLFPFPVPFCLLYVFIIFILPPSPCSSILLH